MLLQPGDKLGPYEIDTLIGAGGMGKVYKARDTRLNRVVAIKVSQAQFSERFEREAKAVAALNHPNICQLYDVGPNYLVMEFVDGAPIAAPDTPRKLLDLAVQTAEGMAAAHAAPLVHRDLKPDNIVVTGGQSAHPGRVKILDFGLAKTAAEAGAPASTPDDPGPTRTIGLTDAGTTVGTIAYMSPEQARGITNLTAQSDQFSFGLVLYELAAGKRAFVRGSTAETMTAIIREDAEPLPASVPAPLRWVIERLLAKEPADRYDSTRDLYRELKQIRDRYSEASSAHEIPAAETGPAPAPPPSRLGKLQWIAAGVMTIPGLSAASIALVHVREKAPEAPVVRFAIPPPEKHGYGYAAVSPDGKRIAFNASDAQGKSSLWIRNLDSIAPKQLQGTEVADFPLWSPDGRYIAFTSGRQLKKIGVDDGIVEVICDLDAGMKLGAWGPDGYILVQRELNGLYRVPAAGGALRQFTTLNTERKETRHYYPWILPDGKHFLFLAVSSLPEAQGVWIASLDHPEDRRRVLPDLSKAAYSQGHLLFVRRQNLAAQPFDVSSLETTGDAVPLDSTIGYNGANGFADFSVSANGVLALGAAARPVQLTTFDRTGKSLGTFGATSRQYTSLRISPDQSRVAAESPVDAGYELFVFEPARDSMVQLTFGKATGNFPAWSPDGSRIAFGSNRDGVYDIYMKSSSGASTEEAVLKSGRNKFLTDWSRDGRYLLYGLEEESGGRHSEDLWVLPMVGEASQRKPRPYLQDEFDKRQGKFSPDGRWVVYTAAESARRQVYVRSFPSGANKVQISTDGGTRPHWRDDGRELFFVDLSGRLMAVDIKLGDQLSAGVPKLLFETGVVNTLMDFDVYRGGQSFVVANMEQGNSPVSVILNWSGLLQKVSTKK